jgi:hypothetical protein
VERATGEGGGEPGRGPRRRQPRQELAGDILGAEATLAAPDGAEGGRFSGAMVFSPASSIYGGTDEIQRNIIAERTLGLPRDDLPGRGRPYAEVLRSTSRGDQ